MKNPAVVAGFFFAFVFLWRNLFLPLRHRGTKLFKLGFELAPLIYLRLTAIYLSPSYIVNLHI